MNEVEEIRRLLDCVEEHLSQAKDDEERKLRNLDALEFPDLVAAIVDFLQPLLGPYEAAIYWRMFRISVIGNGTQFARISTRGLQAVLFFLVLANLQT